VAALTAHATTNATTAAIIITITTTIMTLAIVPTAQTILTVLEVEIQPNTIAQKLKFAEDAKDKSIPSLTATESTRQ
jgi:regulator of extracellular matrix RemA (YlzA/DUF370 family)